MRALVRGLVTLAGSIGVGAFHASAARSESSCPIPLDGQVKSVLAFAKIASFLTTEPRCVNCHGGVNPHIEGTGPDAGDEAAPASTTEHGGGRIPRMRERAPDGTLLIESGCVECHNDMAPRRDGSKSVWMTAPSFLSFVGKDATTLCKQVKRSTHSATEFTGHLKDDNGGNNFAGTAFKGDRGLDKGSFGDLPPAPPSISHAALMRLGQDWIDAMGGAFKGDESCGCVPQLRGRFAYADVSPFDSIKVSGDLVWKADDNVPASGSASPLVLKPTGGQLTVEVKFNNPGASAGVCKGSGKRTFSIDELAPGALRYMKLEIAEGDRYSVTLVIPDSPDPFPRWEFDGACIWPNVTSHQPVPVHHVSVVLGKQQGAIDPARGIVGELAAPIRRGPRTITGNWSFDAEE